MAKVCQLQRPAGLQLHRYSSAGADLAQDHGQWCMPVSSGVLEVAKTLYGHFAAFVLISFGLSNVVHEIESHAAGQIAGEAFHRTPFK